jgi:hypothetical protein
VSQSIEKGQKTGTKAFISFKTVPDEARAEYMASRLKECGVPVTFIHGDVGCPYAPGSSDADAWIREFLDSHSFNILISVASQESMRSKWVLHEFWRGLSSADIILLLWCSGPDPAQHFIPVPRSLARWLPTEATTYLVDCREGIDLGIRTAEVSIKEFSAIRRNRSFRRFWILLVALLLILIPGWMFMTWNNPTGFSETDVENLKQLAGAWIIIIFIFVIVVYPSYKLPSTILSRRLRLLTYGFGLKRWGGMVWCLTVLCSGFALGAISSGMLGAVTAIVAGFIGESILNKLVARSYQRSE